MGDPDEREGLVVVIGDVAEGGDGHRTRLCEEPGQVQHPQAVPAVGGDGALVGADDDAGAHRAHPPRARCCSL